MCCTVPSSTGIGNRIVVNYSESADFNFIKYAIMIDVGICTRF